MLIDPPTLRLLWQVVEEILAPDLLSLNDPELVARLLVQLRHQKAISSEEAELLSNYLQSKLSLVRDLADTQVA